MTTQVLTKFNNQVSDGDDYVLLEEGNHSDSVYGSINNRERTGKSNLKQFSNKAYWEGNFEKSQEEKRSNDRHKPLIERNVTIHELGREIQGKLKHLLKNEESALTKYMGNGVLVSLPNPRSENDDIYFCLGELIIGLTPPERVSSVSTRYFEIFGKLYKEIVNNYCRNIENWIKIGDRNELKFASINLVKFHVQPFIDSILNIKYFKDIIEENEDAKRVLNMTFISIIQDFSKYDLKSFELESSYGAPIWSEIQTEWHFRNKGVNKIKELVQHKANLNASDLFGESKMKKVIEDLPRDEKKFISFIPDDKSIKENSKYQLVNTVKRLGFKEKEEVFALVGYDPDSKSQLHKDFVSINIVKAIEDVDVKHYREDEALLKEKREEERNINDYEKTPNNSDSSSGWFSWCSSDPKKKTTHLVNRKSKKLGKQSRDGQGYSVLAGLGVSIGVIFYILNFEADSSVVQNFSSEVKQGEIPFPVGL